GRDSANAGAMVVDPNDPNVVYVGGASLWTRPGDPPNHSFIRVDTGNMRDTTYSVGGSIPNDGDDISKAATAAAQANFYDHNEKTPATPDQDAYTGEGVYWYDITEAQASKTGKKDLLPPAITSLTFDSQGRLLIGTNGGLWRGVPNGFSYDFTSGG